MKTKRGSRTRRHAAGSAAVLLTALALSLAPAAAALAADGGIAGTVVNGTTAQGVGGAPVTITYFDDQGKIGSAKVSAETDGSFAATPPALATGFQASTTYKGTEYRSQGTQLVPGQTATVKLQVFEGTTDTKDVSLTQWVVWVDQDATTGLYAVQQDFGISNAGDTAYVGTDGVVMRVPLADGAKNLQFLGTFLEQRGKIVDGAYVSDAAVVPGDTSATLRYETPTIGTVPLAVPFSVRDFQLYVPVTLQAQATGIRAVGTITDQTGDGTTVTYQQYTIDVLEPGTDVAVTLSPAAGGTDGSGASSTLLYVAAAIAVVAGAAFLILWLRRGKAAKPSKERQRHTVAASKAAARNARTGTAKVAGRPSNGHTTRPPARTASVDVVEDDDVQLLVDEIAALDLSFEQGLLDERTYRRLRVAAKDRLLLARETPEGRGVPR